MAPGYRRRSSIRRLGEEGEAANLERRVNPKTRTPPHSLPEAGGLGEVSEVLVAEVALGCWPTRTQSRQLGQVEGPATASFRLSHTNHLTAELQEEGETQEQHRSLSSLMHQKSHSSAHNNQIAKSSAQNLYPIRVRASRSDKSLLFVIRERRREEDTRSPAHRTMSGENAMGQVHPTAGGRGEAQRKIGTVALTVPGKWLKRARPDQKPVSAAPGVLIARKRPLVK